MRLSCPMCGTKERASYLQTPRGETTFEIARCNGCNFIFVANPQGETFHAVQAAPAEVPERARHRQIKRVCDHVLIRRSPAEKIHDVVEVGAGWGGLAQVFARDDRYRYVGLEPGADRAAFCRSRGFDVRQGLFQGPESAGLADAIIIDNVLEHVEHPDDLVRAAASSLREAGMLVIVVPNARDIRQFHRPWRERHHWQPHCHINYFSAHDIGQLFARHGVSCRFFGLEAIGGIGDDIELVPRVLADMIGLHLFGLNCYGIKLAPGQR